MLPPIFFKRCIHFCMAMLCLHCLERVFSSCGELVPLWLQSMGSRCAGFSSCGACTEQLWLPGSRALAQ